MGKSNTNGYEQIYHVHQLGQLHVLVISPTRNQFVMFAHSTSTNKPGKLVMDRKT